MSKESRLEVKRMALLLDQAAFEVLRCAQSCVEWQFDPRFRAALIGAVEDHALARTALIDAEDAHFGNNPRPHGLEGVS